MKFIYSGKYNGDESSLPQRDHPEGYVPFREVQNFKLFSLLINILAVVITAIFCAIFMVRQAFSVETDLLSQMIWLLAACMLSMLVLMPHELIHAICFKGEVKMYVALDKMMLFVIGTEDMSKGRFIFMSALPTIIFGVIPFVIGMIFPKLTLLGCFGAIALGQGAGDMYNIFNALTQVPKGALIYNSGLHTFWHPGTTQR